MPSLFAIVDTGVPYITIGNLAKNKLLPTPATLPAGTANGCAFSPDGSKLVVAHATSPYITIYNTSDWSKTELPHRVVSQGRTVAFASAGGLTLRGEVRDIDGYVASRRVRVYERATGELCAETVSSPVDGSYEAKVYEGNVPYDVQFMADDLENLNDLFYARSVAGTP